MKPNHIPVCPTPPEYPVTGTANYGPTAASTSFEFMVKGHMYRIRQTGAVQSFTIYAGATTNVTGVQFRVWRENGGVYDLVGQSESFSSITANAINRFDLATPFTAEIGDYVGVKMTYASSSGSNFIKSTALQANSTLGANALSTVDEDVFTYHLTNGTANTGHDWEAESSLTNEVIRVRCNMKAPDVVFYGDSITSGLFETYSFADDAQAVFDPAASYPSRVASLQPTISYQTIARSGRTTANLLSEFGEYVAPLLPKYLVIMAGVNDINTDVANATIVANIEAILDKAIDLGMYPIVLGVLPIAPHGLNNTRYANIDSLNADLETMVEGSPYNGTFINTTTDMGQFYASGDPGNLWQLVTGYEASIDAVHLSTTGQEALGDVVDAAFTFTPRSETNTGSATGGTVTTDGLYTVHEFSSNGTFTVTGTLNAQVFVAGSGGGGAGYFGGGGGAGRLLHRNMSLSAGDYPVTIGAPGAGGNPLGTISGTAGASCVFDTLTAEGGGPGSYNGIGGDGACGGGAGSTGATGPAGGTGTHGGNGGAAQNSTAGYPAGGGGGFLENGGNASHQQGGRGGNGLELAITGVSKHYGVGAGGGTRTGTGGAGGRGGSSAPNGGAGFTAGTDGATGTGNGGSGASGEAADDAQTGGKGGDGSVIIRYLTASEPPDPGDGDGKGFFMLRRRRR